MKILLISFGSRGDVQPYVALGKGLNQAGHRVMLCTADFFKDFVLSAGLEYGFMTADLLTSMDSDVGKDVVENKNVFSYLRAAIKLMRESGPLAKQMMVDSWEVAKTFQPDLILYNSKAGAAVHIAEVLKIEAVMVNLQPLIVPTTAFSAIGLPDLGWGAWYNRFTYRVILWGNNTFKKMINDFRQEYLGLASLSKGYHVLQHPDGRPVTVFHGFSEHLVPRPPDWPDHSKINGYWFLDHQPDYQPPQDLADFLAAGPPPVYIGFGSMAGRDPQKKAQMMIAALQETGYRGIIATGWGGLSVKHLPKTIFQIEKVPHAWLFPQVAAVVHHGGAGTTAAGLRAGKPTLICPFFADQPFWGKAVYQAGVGPAPIPQRKLTVERLSAALKRIHTDRMMLEKAAALGEKIRAEDGIGQTVRLINEMFGS